MTESRLLVVVFPTGSAIETVEYALREARDVRAELDEPVVVEVLVVVPADASAVPTTLRTQIEALLSEFETSSPVHANIDLRSVDGDDSLSRTEAVIAHVRDAGVSRVIIEPDSDFSIERLRETFGVTRIELAPSSVSHERRPLVHPGGIRRLVTIFGLTYFFYLAIGGFTGGLDLLTGAISAGVVALSLSHVALREEPKLGRTGSRLVRMVLFLPVLLWEIVKANFSIAYVILHPRLPIDPSMKTVDAVTENGLEQMVLANSITLTPGTLTVDVRDEEFTIHSLTASAREDLAGGRLERLVVWVFHGAREGPRSSNGGETR